MPRKEINRYYYKLRFRNSILDIFSAPRLALKFQIIYIGFTGIMTAYSIALICSYLIMKLFSQYYPAFHFAGIIPLSLPSREFPFVANFLLFVGYTIALSTFLATTIGMAVRIVEELKGDREFKISQIRKYIKNNFFNIFFTPIGFFLLLFFLMSLSSILVVLIKIPVIGKYLMVVTIPAALIICIVVIFTIIATTIGILFFPSIAVTWDADVKGIIFQAFSILWSRPWMLITGMLISVWNAVISLITALAVFSGAFWLLMRLLIIMDIINVNFALPKFSIYFFNNFNIYTQFIHLPMSEKIIVFYYIMFVTVAVAYSLGAFIASQTLLFIRLKKIENDIDLLEVL